VTVKQLSELFQYFPCAFPRILACGQVITLHMKRSWEGSPGGRKVNWGISGVVLQAASTAKYKNRICLVQQHRCAKHPNPFF
jgi:hypothetical protein